MSNEGKGWIPVAAITLLLLAGISFYVFNQNKTTSPTGGEDVTVSTPAPTVTPSPSPTPTASVTPSPTATTTPIININVNTNPTASP